MGLFGTGVKLGQLGAFFDKVTGGKGNFYYLAGLFGGHDHALDGIERGDRRDYRFPGLKLDRCCGDGRRRLDHLAADGDHVADLQDFDPGKGAADDNQGKDGEEDALFHDFVSVEKEERVNANYLFSVSSFIASQQAARVLSIVVSSS